MNTSLGAFARAQLARRVDEFLAVLRPLAELAEHGQNLDAEQVHDLRVANRRLREAVRVFRPLAPKRRRRTLSQLKDLMDAAGQVRNCDIAIELCQVEMPDRRAAALDELRRQVRRVATPKFEERLRRVSILHPDRTPARPSAAGLLGTLSREYFVLGREVSNQPTGARLHELRLAAKHLRYAFEVFAELSPAMAKAKIKSMKRLQDLLGDLNDCRTTKALLGRRITAEQKTMLSERFTKLREEFLAHWRTSFDAEGAEAAWLAAVERALAPTARGTAARSGTAVRRRKPSS